MSVGPKIRFRKPDGSDYHDYKSDILGNLGVFDKTKHGSLTKDEISGSANPCILYGQLYNEYSEVISNVKSLTDKKTSGRAYRGDVLFPASTYADACSLFQPSYIDVDEVMLGSDIIKYSPINELSGKYLSYLVNGKLFSKFAKLAQGNTVIHIHKDDLASQRIYYPADIEEQDKIVVFLSEVNNLITSTEHEIKCIEQLKQAMLQKMFPKKGERIPEIRFSEYADNWSEYKFEELCTIISNLRRCDYPKVRKYIVTEATADTLPFLQVKDLTKLNIDYDTDYYIPKSVSEQYPQINLNEKCILFPLNGLIVDKVCLFPGNRRCFPDQGVCVTKLYNSDDVNYIYYYMCSKNAKNQLRTCIKVGKVSCISIKDIKELSVLLPSEEERKRIGELFSSLDNLIALYYRKVDAYKKFKKAMIQKMFI